MSNRIQFDSDVIRYWSREGSWELPVAGVGVVGEATNGSGPWGIDYFVAMGAPLMFKLWGIPFVLVGCYMVLGRFLADVWQRAKTSYAVTNERAIIISGVFRRNVKSLNLRTLTDVSFSERQDGSGTITFGQQPPFYWYTHGLGPWPGMPVVPSFELVPDAKAVYETLRNAQRDA